MLDAESVRKLKFTVSFRVTIHLGSGIGLVIGLGSGLGELGLGEMVHSQCGTIVSTLL